jgi:hypothetical protein
MALRATLAVVVAAVAALAPLSAAAPAPTPDERLVSELLTASRSAQAAQRSLASPSPQRAAGATKELRQALASIDAARKIAPRAVGALENRSMRVALQQGRTLTRVAQADVSKGRFGPARSKLTQVIALKAAALREFGRPLRREFTAKAVNRSFPTVPLYREYSGVTASASEEVVEIVIGRATRATANAGEPGRGAPLSQGLPIAEMTAYQIQDPIGRYTSNWCTLADGLITCPLRPTLTRDHLFTVAFTPKLARGTEVLVKFRAASGRTTYSLYTVR